LPALPNAGRADAQTNGDSQKYNNWNNNSDWKSNNSWKNNDWNNWKSNSSTVADDAVKVQDSSGRAVSEFQVYEKFTDAPFPKGIQDALAAAGFPSPSQIQSHCWPLACKGTDVIGVAATGSGKTISFLLPAFAYFIDNNTPTGPPSLLVLAPTRELAIQIQAESDKFGKSINMVTVCCYGGAPKPPQAAEISRGVHGVIGTPGRVNDFVEGGQLRMDRVVKLVLDEADRMLDMGFEPQIRAILKTVPPVRHTMFFTATWPKNIRNLAYEFLRSAYTVTIGNRDELKGNQDITQTLQTCRGYEKNDTVFTLLKQSGVADRNNSIAKAIVFCSTKKMCDQLAQWLDRKGVPCSAIHGDKNQRDREWSLNGLKEGRLKVLVATDVAARGLDIKGCTLVVNYDPASNTEDYVHRIGRTGRAGQKGHAVALIGERDTHAMKGIIQVMKRTNQPVPKEFEDMSWSAPPPPGKGKGKDKGAAPSNDSNPNFKPGLCSGEAPTTPALPEGVTMPAPHPDMPAEGESVSSAPVGGSVADSGSGGGQWQSGSGGSSWNDKGSWGRDDNGRGRDRDDRGGDRGRDRGGGGRDRDDRGGDRGRRSPERRRSRSRKRSPSRKRRRSPSVRRSRKSPSVRRKQRKSSSGSSGGRDKRRQRKSPSVKKPAKRSPSAKKPAPTRRSPSVKKPAKRSPSAKKPAKKVQKIRSSSSSGS
jgi:ATP-dependent RNA helicase DDX5/DBP2